MKLRKIETGIAAMDMTPMIAIVFQLLTLLMIGINLENTKADERLKLPRDLLARPPIVNPEHELVLNFGYQRLPSGERASHRPEVFYNGGFVDVRRIGPELEMEKRIIGRTLGDEAIKDVTVRIEAAADIPNGLVQELIKQCQQAGFSRFSLRTMSEEP